MVNLTGPVQGLLITILIYFSTVLHDAVFMLLFGMLI